MALEIIICSSRTVAAGLLFFHFCALRRLYSHIHVLYLFHDRESFPPVKEKLTVQVKERLKNWKAIAHLCDSGMLGKLRIACCLEAQRKGVIKTIMLDICYYSSDFYAPYTGISMLSLCENNKALDLRLHCIDSGISDENKSKMEQVALQYERELHFYDFDQIERYLSEELGLPPGNGSYATYIKIFPELLFRGMDRLLFIDGDTVINGSLAALDELDLGNHVFAGVRVPLVYEKEPYLRIDPNNLKLRFVNIGYYSIGVFFVNLKRWAELDFGNKVLAVREKYHKQMAAQGIDFVDEMILNLAALEGGTSDLALELHPIYNSVAHNIPRPRAIKRSLYCGYINKANLIQAWKHPIIIHYCMFKPWYTDTYSPHRKTLEKYIKMSPWPKPYQVKLYTNFHDKVFGKLIHPLPYDWMLDFATKSYHRLKWLRVFPSTFLAIWKQQGFHAAAEATLGWGKSDGKRKKPLAFRIITRRLNCLWRGDWKGAFTVSGKKGENHE